MTDLNLLYMDTNSYFVEMRKDPYKVIKEYAEEFNTSDYDKDHNCYDLKNTKVIGKFKDELNGVPLEEYCGLRLKMYTYSFETKESKKINPVKCKGIKKSVVNKTITMDNLKRYLFEDKEEYREMNCIRSYKHELYSIKVNKLALSPKDEKRFVTENKIVTLPWGHMDICK